MATRRRDVFLFQWRVFSDEAALCWFGFGEDSPAAEDWRSFDLKRSTRSGRSRADPQPTGESAHWQRDLGSWHREVLLASTGRGQESDPERMCQRYCRFCQRPFQPSRFHPEQAACSDQPCQRQRRSQNRQQQLARDAEYREVCRDSARKWRTHHPGYWQQYRAAKPESVAHNRAQQQQRDLRQRLADLANNNSALDLKSSVAGVWWLGSAARELANNNLASAQVFILQGSARQLPLRQTSCKQQPFGVLNALA
jgi:hypothetical protein